jgi:hypothetical protein
MYVKNKLISLTDIKEIYAILKKIDLYIENENDLITMIK